LPKQAHVKVAVFNILGQEFEILKNETLPLDNYKLSWNSMNLASGVYLSKYKRRNLLKLRKWY